jgi:predicted transposase/invertase (TIGR01784 family)
MRYKAMGKMIDNINFAQLMDLRVDYAFKLFFTMGDTHRLISLLNAIFANKGIPRSINVLTVLNPFLEKMDDNDKLSIVDLRANLSDGSEALVEMHLYDRIDIKYKTLRSWSRAYGEELRESQKYREQKPIISIAFINGPITDAAGAQFDKIHALFHIAERDDHRVLLDDLELHYINMQAFVKAITAKGRSVLKSESGMFDYWMMLITQKELADKDLLAEVCEKEGEIKMAMETLAQISEDKIKRQAYQRRLDELHSYNKMIKDSEENRIRAEENRIRAEELEKEIEVLRNRIKELEANDD